MRRIEIIGEAAANLTDLTGKTFIPTNVYSPPYDLTAFFP